MRGRSAASPTSRAAPSPSRTVPDLTSRGLEDARAREGSWAGWGRQELSKADAWERLSRW